jgi:hypothetical protein
MPKTCKECKYWLTDGIYDHTWRICVHNDVLKKTDNEGKAIEPDWTIPDWCPLVDKEEDA